MGSLLRGKEFEHCGIHRTNMSKVWKSGLFKCEDVPTCLLSNFASPYVIYKDSEKLDKPNQILWTVLSFFVPCVPILMFRQKVREQNGIEGNDCEDAAISFLCPGCGLAQTTAETDVKLL